jgi:DNA-binding NarL/FixJ family response regulator
MTDLIRGQVLCIDDHPIVRQGIATLLSVEPDVALVAQAANGREAIQQFRAHRPDVTLMDLQMPAMGGIDAIDAIRTEFPDARIIVLTTYAGDAQAQRAFQAGVVLSSEWARRVEFGASDRLAPRQALVIQFIAERANPAPGRSRQ